MRNVRNFWIDLRVDGRKTMIGSGPRSKSGGFGMRICMRENGKVRDVMLIKGAVEDDGNLCLMYTTDEPDTKVSRIRTIR